MTSKWSKGTGGPAGDEAQNLVTDSPSGFRMTAFGQYQDDDSASTLKQRDHKDATDIVMQPKAFRKSARAQSSEDAESWVDDGQANTLNVFDVGDTRTTHAIVEPPDVESLTPWPEMGDAMRVYGDTGPSPSLKMHSPNIMATYGVRRLTPVECERLQSFPDGWTEPAGSDSARYKAMGNAVTVNVVRWILNRMVQAG